MAAFQLKVYEGRKFRGGYPLEEGALSIGRSRDADVQLDDRTLAPIHARLVPHTGGQWLLEPKGRLTVNGGTVGDALTLALGDRIQVGRYELEVAPTTVVTPARRPSSGLSRSPFKKKPAPRQASSPFGEPVAHTVVPSKDEPARTSLLTELLEEAARLGSRGVDPGFPVLITSTQISLEAAQITRVYPLGRMQPKRAQDPSQWGGHPPRACFYIGRGEDNDIAVVADMSVSKRHAAVMQRSDRSWCLIDLSSSGTRVDEVPLPAGGEIDLDGRETIEMGERTGFTFLSRPVFHMILDNLLSARRSAGGATTQRSPSGRQRRTARTPSGRLVSDRAQEILDRLGGVPFKGGRYLVYLDGAQMEEVHAWPALVMLIHQKAEQIIAIEARSADERVTVYRRP